MENFIEFPKWITLDDGKQIIVDSKEDELKYTKKPEEVIVEEKKKTRKKKEV